MTLRSDMLPDEKSPYFLASGEGDRYLFGTQLATVIAPARSSGNVFELVVLEGAKEDSFPLHRHKHTHEAIFLLDGKLELTLDGRIYLLAEGDYASIPAQSAHSYRMRSHRTRMLSFTTGSEVGRLYSIIGAPTDLFGHPEQADGVDHTGRFAEAEAQADIQFITSTSEVGPLQRVEGGEIPTGVMPYVLEAGEGKRLVAADQLFTVLTTQKNTDGQFIAVMTEGPKGNAIIQHYHEQHTEMFFCIDGQMTVWANGQELPFYPGDFLHIPPNTVHSYRLDAHYTRFLGFLTPGLFEPFFHTIGDPYAPHTFPRKPGPFHFDRLMQGVQTGTLDLKVVGPPPDGSGSPGGEHH